MISANCLPLRGAVVMEVQAQECPSMEGNTVVVVGDLNLREVISGGSLEFDDWTSLISEIEKTYPDDVEKICLVYDAFLCNYPLCYGYWRKYAGHMVRLCSVDKVVEVFEQAVLSATYSVDVWVDYCSFATLVFKDASDIRRLFNRGISFVGKDYSCHTLWDKYIEFEFSQQSWNSLAHIYIQTLRFPSKKLSGYYDSFKKLADIWKEEMNAHCNSSIEIATEPILGVFSASYKRDDISGIIKELLDPSMGLARTDALQKYINIGEQFYQKSSQLNEKIKPYETLIKRSYFHVKPLDVSQLETWHQYLDFAESNTDFDWAVKLYERCLIPCANYPEFWMRYVEFVERNGGREIANLALDRATCTFLQRESVIHLFNARYKEHVGNVLQAHAAFLLCTKESDTDFVERVVNKANMEKRLGNFVAASNTFKEALEMALANEKLSILPLLYVHFSRLKYVIDGSEDAARDILIDGIKHVPDNKLLIEELIKFAMMHGGSRHLNVVDSIISNAISPCPDVPQCLNMEDRESISKQYLELVDLCGMVLDLRKAWYRHMRLFPHSVRSSFRPSTGSKRWQMTKEAPQEKELSSSLAADPVTSQESDKKLQIPENNNLLSDQIFDNKPPLLENENTSVDQATADLMQLREPENNVAESGHIISDKALKPPKQPLEQHISLNLAEFDPNDNDRAQVSVEISEGDVQQDFHHRPDSDLNPLSLERLSLDGQETEPPELVTRTSCDSEAHQENSLLHLTFHQGEASSDKYLSNKRTPNSEACQRNSMSNEDKSMSGEDANTDQFAFNPNGNLSPSSSASREKTITQGRSQPQVPVDAGRKWHQRSNSDRFHRDSKFRSRRESHKRPHQQQHTSAQHLPRAERGGEMPSILGQPPQPVSSHNLHFQQNVQSQYYGSAAHSNLPTPQVSLMQNMQQQNIPHASQSQPFQFTTCPEALVSQYPMQSDGQYGNVQNIQAYNNYMLQCYYYQQQQQFLWQQQPQQQQLLQQQFQQQLLQMQFLQQQQLEQQQFPTQQQQLPNQQQQQQQQEQAQLLQSQQQQPSPQPHQPHLQQQQLLHQKPHQLLQPELQQQQLLYLQQQQLLQQQPQLYHQLQLQQQQHHQQLALAGQQQGTSDGSGEKNAVSQGHHSSAAATGTLDTPSSDHPESH